MKNSFSWLAALLFLSASGFANAKQSGWLENGKPVAVAPARASDGAFGAMLVLTDDWDGFLKRWAQPTAGFEMSSVGTIRKGQPLASAVIFTGCKAGDNGNCSVSGDFLVIDPNGKVYADQHGANIWSLAPPDPRLQLSVESLGVSLDPPDPLGTYTMTATITDLIAKKTLKLRTTFEAK
jgi:hypothetical protein